MRKIIGSGVMLLGLFSIIMLFPRIEELNAEPWISPPTKDILPSPAKSKPTEFERMLLRKNVTIRAVAAGGSHHGILTHSGQPLANLRIYIFKLALGDSGNVEFAEMTNGWTDENGVFKVMLSRKYQLTEAISSSSYFIRFTTDMRPLVGNLVEREEARQRELMSVIPPSQGDTALFPMRFFEFNMEDLGSEQNYPETNVPIWLIPPDHATR